MRLRVLLLPLLCCALACPASADPTATPTLSASISDAQTFDIRGVLAGVSRARFSLRTASGCTEDVTLPALTSGASFTLALDPTNLERALGCAIEVEENGSLGEPLYVSPDATLVSTHPSLSLDPFALVSSALDRSTGDLVRVTVVSHEPAEHATLTIASTTYRAILAPEGRLLFEVPARIWANAIVERADFDVDVATARGRRTLKASPAARVERSAEDDDGRT